MTAVWIVLVTTLLGAAPFLRGLRRRRLAARSGIAEVDALDDREFARRLEAVFWRLGYRVQARPHDARHGADLLVATAGTTIAVRARGGDDAVSQVAAARRHYRCDGALAVTNGRFSGRARREAHSLGVVLWERDALIVALVEAA